MKLFKLNDNVACVHLDADEAKYLDCLAFDMTLQYPGSLHYKPLPWTECNIFLRFTIDGKPNALCRAFEAMFSKDIWDQGFSFPNVDLSPQ